MIRVFFKELNGFLNSLIAYVVIGVFLTAMGLLTWVFPETSVLEYGYADLDTLFSLGPYVLIFLVPAVTMRSLAEEKKLGTLELLMTKPLTDWQIIRGKFLACWTLVILSLAPTLIYYFSIVRLGNPVGNIDTPGVAGSYIGLLLLGAVFCSIGLLASALTNNQIVAFILAAFLCFLLYSGFESLSTLADDSSTVLTIRQFGIVYHYEGLSKGLIDSRDLVYFISVIGWILLLARTALAARQWTGFRPLRVSRKAGDSLIVLNGAAVLMLVNMITSFWFFRVDLTDEKRYTIKPATRELLRELESQVYVEVFLDGDLNPGFRRFRKSVQETLEEFRIYSRNKVHYSFTNPGLALSEKAKNEFMAGLAAKGIQGMRVIDSRGGERTEKIVFPGAVVNYNGFESGVMLLKGSRLAVGSQEVLNQSIEGIEYELASTIQKLSRTTRKRIGLLTGHGELDSLQLAGLNNALLEQYDVFHVDLPRKKSISQYDVIIVPKPIKPFSETDKYKLDQYVMRGGSVVFLLDRLDANMDSAARNEYYAWPVETNLDDLLFKYGIRINPDLVRDRVAGKYPVVVGEEGGRPRMVAMDWPWFPLINHYAEHVVTRNLDATLTRFVSSVDTVKAPGIRKTPLLFSSQYSRKVASPVKIGIADVKNEKPTDVASLEGHPVALGYLMEGRFTSLYNNRFTPEGADTSGRRSHGEPSKIVVLADGDIGRNDISPRTGQPQALGFDAVSGYTFANQDLIMNAVAYMTEDDGLISARGKEVKIRPLDREQVRGNKTFWQVVNIGLPLVALGLFAVTRIWWRKRRYASFQ